MTSRMPQTWHIRQLRIWMWLLLLLLAWMFGPGASWAQRKSRRKRKTNKSRTTTTPKKINRTVAPPERRKKKEEDEEEDEDEDEEKKKKKPKLWGLMSWSVYSGLRFNYVFDGRESERPHTLGGSLLAGTEMLIGLGRHVNIAFTFDIGGLELSQNLAQGSTLRATVGAIDLTQSAQAQEAAIATCIASGTARGFPEAQVRTDCNNAYNPLNRMLLESFFIRQLATRVWLDKQNFAQMTAGMYTASLGRAFILDNYVLGVKFDLNWNRRTQNKLPFQLEMEVFLPDSSFTENGKKSPVANLKFSYTKGEDRKLSLFASYLYDGNNLAGRILLPVIQDIYMFRISEIARSRAGDVINPECGQEGGTFTAEQKTAIQRSFSKLAQDTVSDANLDILYREVCNQIPQSSGHHLWFGVEGKWTFNEKFFLAGAAILYYSQSQVGLPKGSLRYQPVTPTRNTRPSQQFDGFRAQQTGQALKAQQASTGSDNSNPFSVELSDENVTGLGFAGELAAGYRWFKGFTTSAFFLVWTGQSNQAQNINQVTSFFGILSQLRYTNVFFNGGVNAYSSQRFADLNSDSLRGYMAPGMVFSYTHNRNDRDLATIKLTTTAFWSFYPQLSGGNQGTGTFYGAEFNLNTEIVLLRWMKLVTQFDIFAFGDFYPIKGTSVFFRAIVGLDFQFGSAG
ncbi:MAG: hypothetical protein EP343_15210 [Deltaproteobacteria bacterium]|nr:MAG: hypothetical protein EP343_15210 [Deltaproteobacteria bacterium]